MVTYAEAMTAANFYAAHQSPAVRNAAARVRVAAASARVGEMRGMRDTHGNVWPSLQKAMVALERVVREAA